MDDNDLHTIAAEITRRRFGDQNLDPEVLDQITEDHAERLENIMTGILVNELTRLGKVDEFDRYTENPNADPSGYLSRVIPNYEKWQTAALQSAVDRLLTGK